MLQIASLSRLFAVGCLSALLCLVTGCGVSSTGTATSPIAKEAAQEGTGTVPASFFGMVVKAQGVQPGVTTGARRLWDSGVTWAEVEPARGSFVWSALDAEVAAAQQGGAEVALTLGMTPEWASSEPGLQSSYGAGATAMPADLGDWDAYVTAVAARYQGRIGAYEVWNAPENAAYWAGAAGSVGADMATLALHAAVAVHGADKAAVVVSPALSPAGLSAFLAAGGGSAVDAVGASLLSGGAAPEMLTAELADLHTAMEGTAADGKPLWNDGGAWALPGGGLTDATQAAYTARALVLSAGYAVRRMHWYAWDARGTETLDLLDAGMRPTAAAAAYGTVEGWLAGARMNGCTASPSGVWSCQVVHEGKTGWIVWSVNGTVRNSGLGMSTVAALDGSVSAVDADGSVMVGEAPVLLQ